jgi:protein-tyrosine phosphatase
MTSPIHRSSNGTAQLDRATELGRFERIFNFRDLAQVDPQHIEPGVVFRSALPSLASGPDRSELAAIGISQVIDLRSDAEVVQMPSISLDGAVSRHVPLVVRPWDFSELDEGQPVAEFLAQEYIGLLNHSGDEIRQVLELVTHHNGPTLVHCTAGKDRTGIIVALLSIIAAAPISRIIEDYERSASAMPDLLRSLEAACLTGDADPIGFPTPARRELFLAAPSVSMQRTFERLFPTPHRFFDEISFSRVDRRALQARLQFSGTKKAQG